MQEQKEELLQPDWRDCTARAARRAPDRSRLPRCRLRLEARHLVAAALLARARQLSTRTLFPFLASAEGESL